MVVAAVTATTAAVGVASYVSARRFALAEAERRLNLTAIVEASRFRDVLSEKFRNINNWSHLEVMRALVYRDVDKQIADFLDRSLSGSPEDVAVACIDRVGAVVASAGDQHVIAALNRSTGESFSVLHLGAARLFQLSAPMAVPDAPEDLQGRLLLAVDPRKLLEQGSPTEAGTYAISLLTGDGALLVGEESEPRSIDFITAHAAVGAPELASQGALILEIAEPVRAALAPIYALRRRILLAGLIVLAVASALGVTVAIWISRPIRRLTDAVEDIRERGRLWGPLDVPVGPGELGVLAEAFMRMARSLTLAEERNAAQSRMALLGEVATNIAHEVRTPLASLRSAGQMLARNDRDDATRQRLAALIVSEADRLDQVVANLVGAARPPAGTRRPCEVAVLVDRARATLEPLISDTGCRLEVSAARNSLTVEADPDQMHQALLNVLRNALDASPRKSRIDVAVDESGGDVIIEVKDHGPGFAASVLERPFAPFQTTKAQGTGLGLAIVRRIVEEHGGHVTLSNVGSEGACVSIRMPKRVNQ